MFVFVYCKTDVKCFVNGYRIYFISETWYLLATGYTSEFHSMYIYTFNWGYEFFSIPVSVGRQNFKEAF